MGLIATLENLLDRPETLAAPAKPEGLGRAGVLGYAAGTAGVFLFLRMNGAVPPGLLSFLVAFSFVLSANYLFAASIHLFMDLTGAPAPAAGAARLFLAFGCTDYLMGMLVPFGFLDGVKALHWLPGLLICVAALLYARVRVIRRLYPVSNNKSVLSLLLPYFAFGALFFVGMVYGLVWLVWIVV